MTSPSTIQDVPTPCLLVDIDKVKQNTQAMIDRCQSMGLKLRPHMKTHKTIEGGILMTNGTKRQIVVSTIKEAEFYADNGFDDILYGVCFTRDKLPRLGDLVLRLQTFHLMLDSMYGIEALDENPLKDKQWSVFLKVDCGKKRTGALWDSDMAVTLAKALHSNPNIHFQGLYTHDGDSYWVQGTENIAKVASQAADKILSLAEKLKAEGIPVDNVGTGSTPSSTHPGESTKHLTELHPGNYIFYDAMQCVHIKTLPLEHAAARVATRIIGHYPHRNQILVDCGFLGLSHDGMGVLDGSVCVVQDHPNLRMVDMSQEIGYLEPKTGDLPYEEFPIGSMLMLYPYHACTTCAMHPEYYIHSGDKIVDIWRPCRGW